MKQEPDAFFRELTGEIAQIRQGSLGWDLLVDFTATPVMPQDRARNTERIFDWCLEKGVRRIALVSNSVTQRMQFRRVTRGSDLVAAFDDVAAAEHWLASEDV